MEFYEKYYRDNGLWEEMTEAMIDINEYHKSEKYQRLNNKERQRVDAEMLSYNKVVLDSIKFYPYPGPNYKVSQKVLDSISVIEDAINNS